MDKKVKETAAQVQTSILSSIYSSFTTAKTVRFDDWRLGSLYTALVILIVSRLAPLGLNSRWTDKTSRFLCTLF